MKHISGKAKVLVPLATMVAAGAVAVGSGATFTSQSAHAVSVTSGTLSHTNSRNGQTLTVTNIRPGESQSGTLTITNTGSIDSTLTLQETADTNGFTAGDLNLKIVQGASTVLYDGNFGGQSNTTPISLGDLPVAGSTTVTYTISLASGAGNEDQGKSASAAYTWVQTQKSTPSTVVSWVPGL